MRNLGSSAAYTSDNAPRAGADAPARRQEGRYKDALALYDRALKTFPNDTGLLCNCAAAHLRLADHRQVRRA